jgi:hypothetical protein
MSDVVVKVIPADPRHIPQQETHQTALNLLTRLAPGGEYPAARIHRNLQYVDAGEYEEGATCPRCARRLHFDWSAEHEAEMDWFREIVHQTEASAEGAQTKMPCCGAEALFEEVQFENSGFAMFELLISNPDIPYPLPPASIQQLESVLGCSLKQVWARY